MSSRPKNVVDEPVRCLLCNIVTATPVDQLEHDVSLMHHMKMDQYYKGSFSHMCNVCQVIPGKLKLYTTHLKGRVHDISMERVKAKWATESTYPTPASFFLIATSEKTNPQKANHPKPGQRDLPKNKAPGKEHLTNKKFQSVPDVSNFCPEPDNFSRRQQWPPQKPTNAPWFPKKQKHPQSHPRNFHPNMQNAQWNIVRYNGNFQNNWPQAQPSYGNMNCGWNVPQHGPWMNNPDNFNWRDNVPNFHSDPNINFNDNRPNFNTEQSRQNQNYNETVTNNVPQYGYRENFNDARVRSNVRGANNSRSRSRSQHSDKSRDTSPKSTRSNKSRDASPKSTRSNKSRDTSPKSTRSNKSRDASPKSTCNNKSRALSPKSTKSHESKFRNCRVDDSKRDKRDDRKNLTSSSKNEDKARERVYTSGNKLVNLEPTKSLDPKSSDSADRVLPEILEGEISKKDSLVHLYFLSSDSEVEGEIVKMKEPRADKRTMNKIQPKINNKGSSANTYNQIMIRRLVNHPCTPRQQNYLQKWLRSQNTSSRISIPSFNASLSGENNALENVMNELPEDILTSLYEAMEQDSESNEPEMEVCVKTEDDDSGNIPWVDFLKSLEEKSDSPTNEHAETDAPEHSKEVIDLENSNNLNNVEVFGISVKQEPMDSPENIEPTDVLAAESAIVSSVCTNAPADNQEPKDTDVVIKLETAERNTNTPTRSISEETPQAKTTPPETPLVIPNLPVSQPTVQSQPESERYTPNSAQCRPPSVTNSNNEKDNFDQSQKDITDWINQLSSPKIDKSSDCPDQSVADQPKKGTESEPPANASVIPSQEIVDQLLVLNNEEEELRSQSQKVEQVISQLYRLLEEWKNKRNEILLQETNLRNKRTKLLENLRGVVSQEKPKTAAINKEVSEPSSSDFGNVRYLGTLDSTWSLIKDIGADLGLNVHAASSTEMSQNIISSSNINEEPMDEIINPDSSTYCSPKPSKRAAKSPKKNNDQLSGKKGRKKPSKGDVAKKSSKKKRKKDAEEVPSSSTSYTKKKKRKDQEETEPLSPDQATMLEDYMTTVMPGHVGVQKSTMISATVPLPDHSETMNSSPVLIEVDSDSATHAGTVFNPIQLHDDAIIDLKMFNGHFYTCSSDKTAMKTDMKDCNKRITFKGHEKTVSGIHVFVNLLGENKVFTSCHDGFLRCFNSETGHCTSKTNLFSPITTMAFGSWGTLYLGLQNGEILPYIIKASKLSEPILGSNSVQIRYLYACSEGSQRLLFIADNDGLITVRNATTGLFVRSLEGKVKPPCKIVVHSFAVYVTPMDKSILIYDLMSGVLLRKITSNASSASGIIFRGNTAICCYLNGSIRCFSKHDWKMLSIYYTCEKSMVLCMASSQNWIYTGHKSGAVQGIQLDFENIQCCEYLKCTLPFGRQQDLKRHVEEEHLNLCCTISKCPWQHCSLNFYGFNIEKKKKHVLSHVSME